MCQYDSHKQENHTNKTSSKSVVEKLLIKLIKMIKDLLSVCKLQTESSTHQLISNIKTRIDFNQVLFVSHLIETVAGKLYASTNASSAQYSVTFLLLPF